MPAWWKGRSKSKPKPSSSRRSAAEQEQEQEQEQSHPVTPKRGKVKGNIFNEILVFRRSKAPSPIAAGGGCGGGGGNVSVFGQPLPLPKSISSPLPSLVSHEHAAVAGSVSTSTSVSVSTSSGSSSASSDEAPDLGFYRYPDTISMPRGRNVAPDLQSPRYTTEDRQLFSRIAALEHPEYFESSDTPRRESQSHGFDPSSNGRTAYSHVQSSDETVYGRRTAISSPGHPFPTSPVHSKAFGLCPYTRTYATGICNSNLHHIEKVNVTYALFCQEIALLSQLSHLNIVQYYGSELVI
ncbi:hypothetical protein B296_00008503 [Ensete ventricosum]|uniref:Protein kinase domain-containing protein n=1 Tax=Ensete ventricosum TaxID=4639 RepID=A0A426Z295_ENSVE|nr:hypothetical protein B296_00008503 [Ensete ventricosum]